MDDAVSNQLDPIVIPGDARRLAIRNDNHCFSDLETRSLASKSDVSMTANIVSRNGTRGASAILPTRGLLRVDTVEKVGWVLHALTVRRQSDCRTSFVKVKRWTDLLARSLERPP